MGAEGVVTADACVGRASQVQRRRELVRVRARRRIDDRVRFVDDLQLLVTPGGALGALVRAVPDLDRSLRQRLTCVGGVEDELGHLPVALVRVVEVVEGVEEPVLERQLAGIAGVGRDVGIDGRRGPGGQATSPPLVVATGIERVAGEVEVILVPVDEVARRRPDLDEIGSTPRAAQRDRGLVEEHVDVGRNVRLAGAALLGLIDEADDRSVFRGKRSLVRSVCGRNRHDQERRQGRRDEENPAGGGTHAVILAGKSLRGRAIRSLVAIGGWRVRSGFRSCYQDISVALQNRVTPLGELIADPGARARLRQPRLPARRARDDQAAVRRPALDRLPPRVPRLEAHAAPAARPVHGALLSRRGDGLCRRPPPLCPLPLRGLPEIHRRSGRLLHPGDETGADAIDARLHAERVDPSSRAQRHHEAALQTLPDGAFVLHERRAVRRAGERNCCVGRLAATRHRRVGPTAGPPSSPLPRSSPCSARAGKESCRCSIRRRTRARLRGAGERKRRGGRGAPAPGGPTH